MDNFRLSKYNNSFHEFFKSNRRFSVKTTTMVLVLVLPETFQISKIVQPLQSKLLFLNNFRMTYKLKMKVKK